MAGLTIGFGDFKKEVAEIQAKQALENRKRIFSFSIKSGERRFIRFLTHAPLPFYQHRISTENYRTAPCTGKDDCPLCNDSNKIISQKKLRGAFLVAEFNPFTKKVYDESGNQTGEVEECYCSVRVLNSTQGEVIKISKLNDEDPISEVTVVVDREGEKLATQYTYKALQDRHIDKVNPKVTNGELPPYILELMKEGYLDEAFQEELKANLPKGYEDCNTWDEVLYKDIYGVLPENN